MLDRKLLRDLRGLAGQVLTIALLIAAGVAVLVMSVSAWLSLREAQRIHYADSRFAEVFTAVKRAPAAILDQIAAIQGVAVVEGRIIDDVRVDWPAAIHRFPAVSTHCHRRAPNRS